MARGKIKSVHGSPPPAADLFLKLFLLSHTPSTASWSGKDNFSSRNLIPNPKSQMERSISTLTFKASIAEAIVEAQKQKKLFVVYISGEDAESTELEKSTWTDLKVADSLAKYCILLHIISGSVDAKNFSAIYPQKSVPCVTAIGYNGVQLWQSEGFVSAEVLASSLEKAWLSLHVQETTVTILSAALASKNSEQSTSGSSGIGSSGPGSSSEPVVPSALMDKDTKSSDARLPETSEMIEEKDNQVEVEVEVEIEDKNAKLDHDASSEYMNVNQSRVVEDEQSTSPAKRSKGLSSTLMVDPQSSIDDHISSDVEDGFLIQENSAGHHSGVPGGASQSIGIDTDGSVEDAKLGCTDDDKADTCNNNTRVTALSDVHLNIRLPSGVSLQEKFSVTSTLNMVKDYVDQNQASGVGSYDLAIPYPRKVFSDEDLSKSLSDLALFNRQALTVVPRQRDASYHRGGSSSSGQITSTINPDSSNANDGGYFSLVRSILSFFNPLSYVGGRASSSNSGQAQTSMWEYSPTPSLHGNYANGNDSRSRQPTTSHFGSNIHTLKHDEDDGRFNERNSFWNGNSTQYGGGNDGK